MSQWYWVGPLVFVGGLLFLAGIATMLRRLERAELIGEGWRAKLGWLADAWLWW